MTEGPTTSTIPLDLPEIGPLEVAVVEHGQGRPFLLLHGGGGPLTVAAWAEGFAEARGARVLAPTHPGFAGTSRPERLDTARSLARVYVALLDALDLVDVAVVGNSLGGWIAAEMAILDSPRVSRCVIVDGVGLEVRNHPVVDFFALTPKEVAAHSYHDPDRYGIDPAALPEIARAAMAGNRATLAAYTTSGMGDPSLERRLAGVRVPTLVVWGDADRIADQHYGRAFAAAIPGARFELLAETGHLPQIESPEKLTTVVWDFAAQPSATDL
jgi:pimeloyl-ACP methyl ester carboxylesterase